MVCERNLLPGGPSNRLIAHVRMILRRYGIRPSKDSKLWYATWQWAEAIAVNEESSRIGYVPRHIARRHRWPSPCEIASQYLLLVVAGMQNDRDLRLHYRAAKCATPFVRGQLARLGGEVILALPPPEAT